MVYHLARIIAKEAASPTVTLLKLQCMALKSFQPGQWIDFRIRTASWVGGYSLASSPKDLPELQIAVRASSTHAAADWVTNHSQVGDEVEIQVGGNCVLVPEEAADCPAVFVAGGIGISPILAMYRQQVEERCNSKNYVYYSSKTEEDLVFASELSDLVRKSTQDSLTITLTKSTSWKSPLAVGTCLVGRQAMRDFLCVETPLDAIYYVCGPPPMQDDAIQLLQQKGVPDKHLVYEKWW